MVPLVDPATGQTWAQAHNAPEAVDAAIASSIAAFNDDDWAKLTGAERGALLRKLGDLIADNAEELGRLESLANGKPNRATFAEMRATARWYHYYASLAETRNGLTRQVGCNVDARIEREPLGVVVAITPFNGALSLGSWKLAPALAAGNVVIIKPPADAPASSVRLAELAIEAGFPRGVVNVVIGDGAIGEALATHSDTAMVTFTGSTAVARQLGAKVTGAMKRFVCEAGGKSAHIVFDDADIDSAVIAATQGAFSATGQTCVAGSRLLLHASIADTFLAQYRASIERLRVGDPKTAATHIGPVASVRQLNRIADFVSAALEEGARVLVGGKSPSMNAPLTGGHWYLPTVIVDVTPDMQIVREEVFGPVVTVQIFDTEEEAVALANSSEFGLAAGFWTTDMRRARRVSRKLKAGTVWVNTYRAIDVQVPFGGYRQSGLGRENGPEALDEFTQIKSVVTDFAPAADPFAY
ncbi:aldehyde dehydrogenase family protein [Nitratireductor aquibiodomus]|uniref:aldehyde dehydrogenase family protein n=1 Tax=Nitratireductor aquibiodomus TaxID=204799 RepID=UPI00192B37E3|nr:aldehyde dehydrogenase family protein [Nitratireductor aquibiodomus]